MKVISFKVEDDIYYKLKEKNLSFRSIFEPYAVKEAQKSKRGVSIPPSIPTNSGDLYKDIQLVLNKHKKRLFNDLYCL